MLTNAQINIRDPFVLVHDGKYYMYGTRGTTCWGEADGFDVYIGDDLEHWDGPHEVFHTPEGFWSHLNYWAPEVHAYGDAFYMLASFKSDTECRGTQILKADSPLGPFVPLAERPVTPRDWECLDGTLYVSPDGHPYMVFCHEWMQAVDGEICALPLSSDLSAAAGEARVLFHASEAPWIQAYDDKGSYVTDGPFLHRCADGTLVMLWSSFGEEGYTEAIAVSDNGDVTGNWIQQEWLLFRKDGGHGMVFKTPDGRLMLALHTPNSTPDERPVFYELTEREGSLYLK